MVGGFVGGWVKVRGLRRGLGGTLRGGRLGGWVRWWGGGVR